MIEAWLRQDPDRWPGDIRRGWRFLIASWSDCRGTILAEDATLWPYKIEEVLDVLAEARETRADPRLSELRRRRAS
jgi:hypothetical protein